MLSLIQALSRRWPDEFNGWVLAKAEYCIYDSSLPVSFEETALKQTAKYALLQVRALSEAGAVCSSLTVTSAAPPRHFSKGRGLTAGRPREQFPENAGSRPPSIKTDSCLCFSRQMIEHYLERSGDNNPIHRLEQAVAPGFLIMEEGLKRLPSRVPCTVSARFSHPIYADQPVFLKQEDACITGFCQGIRCFSCILFT